MRRPPAAPGSASRLSGPRARWSTKTANEPSWPAYPHRGGTRASCSCPLATNTFPFVSVIDSGPRWLGLPPAWATTATPVTGCGRLIASREALGALAANQRVRPPAVMSPIWVPAAASCLASASGTSSLDTRSGVAKYQVALWFAAISRCPVPDGPAAGPAGGGPRAGRGDQVGGGGEQGRGVELVEGPVAHRSRGEHVLSLAHGLMCPGRRRVEAVDEGRIPLDRRCAAGHVEIGRAEDRQFVRGDLVRVVDRETSRESQRRDGARARRLRRGAGMTRWRRRGGLPAPGRRRIRTAAGIGAAAEAGENRDHAENRENDQVNGDETAEPAGAQPRLKAPAKDHERDGAGADQRVGDQPRPEGTGGAGGARARPQPVQEARAPGEAEHDDDDHGERRQQAEDRLQVHPAAAARPEEPPALVAERLVGPVGEKDGERQVRHAECCGSAAAGPRRAAGGRAGTRRGCCPRARARTRRAP